MNDDQPLGMNDDRPNADKSNVKPWQAPILRSIPLQETKGGVGSIFDGDAAASIMTP